ncbi:amino acid adenylation domain-containing protein [Virgibacillus pantothenticus]|uniref:non-ribosomal peptide synthetase n=1 Tax=Virgibacillus pantothenticus TaxID=1473 RepID=UPI001C245C4B|nr:non-ribosomal peptide synthetase [Virgibacillus pantothenticus]MBU8567933.1 amino acid adenylation domain-containing protein [Virgibacillus pantothenticus]MBU8601807.1 amino acid adenylation domain-containing protein [Virgibacillus pantothenticus]MBU8635961.1 amino acid adenylation domain-containing protein [Virgibacillus pantothenticus]MBU8643645.1 amino acid adenylation domain-containing protein [Virgibacillus pantothenticus]MBU8647785.1 amino acid adenylation domain-containing protein [V
MDRASLNILLTSEQFLKKKKYWLNKLNGYSTNSNYLEDNNEYLIKQHRFEIPQNLTKEVYQLAKNKDISIYIILLTVLNILISKQMKQNDIVIGSPLYRDTTSSKTINNLVPIRNELIEETPFKKLLLQVRNSTVEAYEHQNYPHELIIEEVKKEYNIHLDSSRIVCLLKGIHEESSVQNICSDLRFSFSTSPDTILCHVKYSNKLFTDKNIELIAKRYIHILTTVLNNLDIIVSDIAITLEEEKNRIVKDFNSNILSNSNDRTIHELFEEQVKKTPNQIAVVYQQEWITYSQLNKKANKLARFLIKKGIKTESIVALMMKNSIELMISILGVIKAGAAYLPLDKAWPTNRINYMLKDSNPDLLLTNMSLDNQVTYPGEVVNLLTDDWVKEEDSNIPNTCKPNNLVYIVYTSGTTGKPKGVMIEHRNVKNYCEWFKKVSSLNKLDKTLLLSSYAFDLGYTGIYTTLLTGGELHLIKEEEMKNSEFIINYITGQQITFFKGTPTLLKMILSSYKFTQLEHNKLRLITLGGEPINLWDVHLFQTKHDHVKFINHYGPTETTIGCIATPVQINQEELTLTRPRNIVGKPIANTKAYILDSQLNLVGIGIPGELYISGNGVARGYFKNDSLTKEKFLDNPFSENEVIYKTGDIARWLDDGRIEFLGRTDNQVKVRGHRVELEEIEHYLVKNKEIEEAIVTFKKDSQNDGYLCAYLVTNKEIDSMLLRQQLAEVLPDYMIPLYFIRITAVPLTLNGKVNKDFLPEPTTKVDKIIVKPRNPIENKLMDLWKEVLSLRGDIGIHDNFFELGGHSLKATVLRAKIHKEFNIDVPLVELIRSTTVATLAEYLKTSNENKYQTIEIANNEKNHYELSSIQKRMVILSRIDEYSTRYNMPYAFIIKGELNVDRLKLAFDQLILRHEILRTSFDLYKDRFMQTVHTNIDLDFGYYQIKKGEIHNKLNGFIRPFNLSKAPLIRVELLKIEEQKHLLAIDMHHIISDAASIRIALQDICKIYNGEEHLNPLKIQYKDYANWQKKFMSTPQFKEQEEYWLNEFSEIPVLNLPNDYPRSSIRIGEAANYTFSVESETTNNLKKLAKENNATLFMVLLAAYNIILAKYSGQEEIVVGVPIAGRTHNEVEEVMGAFINTLPIKNKLLSEHTFLSFLSEVRDKAIKAYENQDYHFEELIQQLNIERELNRNPLFDVMFDLKTTTDSKFELTGLTIDPYELTTDKAKMDMTLVATENGETINFALQYYSELFKEETIKRFSNHFVNILETVSREPIKKVNHINLLSSNELEKVIATFNNTASDYPKEKTINQLFEEVVAIQPDHVAVVSNHEQISYKELNERSNRLANLLQKKVTKDKQTIGIVAEKSCELVVAILAVLKAGCAYLPIDPKAPINRIQYIMNDSKMETLLVDQKSAHIEFYGNKIILNTNEEYSEKETNLITKTTPKDIAYVMYTSGSSGEPKGVKIPIMAVNNFISGASKKFQMNFTPEDNCLSIANIMFDVSVCELFLPLLNGAKLTLSSDQEIIYNTEKLSKFITDQEITFAYIPPSLLNGVYKELRVAKDKVKLNKLLVGVEPIRHKVLNQYLKLNKNMLIVNGYGPTETTICSSMYNYTYSNEFEKYVSIGSPMQNTKIYIVDHQGRPQPIGIPGELWIAGDGLSMGYLNNEKLNYEKFVTSSYIQESRIYRTGDQARWNSDGTIEFLGRLDNQVKINGYRVQLGEIENKLMKKTNIEEAVVLVKDKENGSKIIIAYIVCHDVMNFEQLKDNLYEELPPYMIPAHIIRVDKIPLTQNGKVNKRELLAIEVSNVRVAYDRPRNDIEKSIVRIWKEALGTNDKISIHDDFFQIGGSSLKAPLISKKVYEEFGVQVPILEIFKRRTISRLSEFIHVNKKACEDILRADNKNVNENVHKPSKIFPNIINSEQLVLLKLSEHSERNLFVIHDGTGQTTGYVELCEQMETDCNIYGLIIKNQNQYAPQKLSIEMLALDYIKIIKTIQPRGPYNLAGWSIGGTIAFEITRQLEIKGEEVNSLLLIDAYIKAISETEVQMFTCDEEKAYIDSIVKDNEILRKIEHITDIKLLWEKAAEEIERQFPSKEYLSLFNSRILRIISEEVQTDPKKLIKWLNIIRSLDIARNQYTPQKIEAKTYFFKPMAEKNSLPEKWSEYTQQPMDIIEIPGDHISALKRPNIWNLAQEFDKILSKSRVYK